MCNESWTPGVYCQEKLYQPSGELVTGVPAFLGYAKVRSASPGDELAPKRLTVADHFTADFVPVEGSYLAAAIEGFFANGGRTCYVAPLPDENHAAPAAALHQGLLALAPLADIDLICAPDIMRPAPGQEVVPLADAVLLQQMVLDYCERAGDRFAILDALPVAGQADQPLVSAAVEQVIRQRQELKGANAALYFPWLSIQGTAPNAGAVALPYFPPCGHVAGIYARSDQRVGVHKAPANERLAGVIDLQYKLSDADQGPLNKDGINCLRIFPGRGIRVWGARTISSDSVWLYVNVRRLFITIGRWIERTLAALVFEPHDADLWARIRREVTAYLTGLLQQGMLKGATVAEAFYVKCDAETNPAIVRDTGAIVTEIGLAPSLPSEFVVVQIIVNTGGVSLRGPL